MADTSIEQKENISVNGDEVSKLIKLIIEVVMKWHVLWPNDNLTSSCFCGWIFFFYQGFDDK